MLKYTYILGSKTQQHSKLTLSFEFQQGNRVGGTLRKRRIHGDQATGRMHKTVRQEHPYQKPTLEQNQNGPR